MGQEVYTNNFLTPTFSRLKKEIEIIFNYYLTRNENNKIDLILLCGGGAKSKGLSNLFSIYFNIPTVKLEYLDCVDFPGTLYNYASAIGAIIRHKEV